MQGTISIFGNIGSGGVTAEGVKKQLAAAASAKELVVEISSNGGEVYEGYTIYNLIKGAGKPITVKINGICASIATLIALAGDKIEMAETATFMIHDPLVGVQGTANMLRKAADQLDQIKAQILAVYKSRFKGSPEELSALMSSETYFNAKDALAAGFVDEIIEPLRAVAYLDVTKFESMDKPDLMQQIAKELSGIKNMFAKFVPKDTGMELEDGSAVTLLEDGTVVKEDGTPLPDGTYKLADGTELVVAGGKKASAQADPLAEAKAEIESLKAQLAERDAAFAQATNELEEKGKAFAELEAKVTEVMNKIPVGRPSNFVAPNPKMPLDKANDEPLAAFVKNIVKQNYND
jgi:ATP-dependent protease ClpP protease subunit